MEGILAPWHWIILVGVILLIFGPNKVPEIASKLGHALNSVRKEVRGITAESSGTIKETMDAVKPVTELFPGKIATPVPSKGMVATGKLLGFVGLDETLGSAAEKSAEQGGDPAAAAAVATATAAPAPAAACAAEAPEQPAGPPANAGR